MHPNTSDKAKKVPLQVGNGIGKGSEESMNTRSFSMRLKIKWRIEETKKDVQLLLQKVFACTVSEERLEWKSEGQIGEFRSGAGSPIPKDCLKKARGDFLIWFSKEIMFMQSYCLCAHMSMFPKFLSLYSCRKKLQSDLAVELNYQKDKVLSSFIEVGVQVKEREKI